MVEPLSLNFKVFTVKYAGVRNFTVFSAPLSSLKNLFNSFLEDHFLWSWRSFLFLHN